VPAGGFYEWKKEGTAKQPYLIRRRDRSPIAERWDGHGTQQPIETLEAIARGLHVRPETVVGERDVVPPDRGDLRQLAPRP
jgi:SOS response associated peptidase (SRAP)